MKTYGLQYRQFLTLENPALLLELEAIILRAAEPPYNVQIPTEMSSHASQTSRATFPR